MITPYHLRLSREHPGLVLSVALVSVFSCAFWFGLAWWCDAAQKPADYGSVKVSEIVSVYDGDTFTVNIAGWPDVVGRRIGVRVLHVDTPELTDPRDDVQELAVKARDYVDKKLRSAKVVELRGIRRDKYFRLLAEVYADGEQLSDALLAEKLAKPYEGGTKEEW